MQRTSFEEMTCSIARTLTIVGEWWTPLIIRDIYGGITRFDALQRNLGISRKVLAQRLATLVEHGVIQRTAYQDRPRRYDYGLTEKGADLGMVLLALKQWGDRWVAADGGTSLLLRHDRCGMVTTPVVTCSGCGELLRPGEVSPVAQETGAERGAAAA